MVSIFSDLNTAQNYKMPFRDSPHHETEIPLSFNYLKLFKANEDTEAENFLFEIEDQKYIYVGEDLVGFETGDEIVEYFPKKGFNDVNDSYASTKENFYFMLH